MIQINNDGRFDQRGKQNDGSYAAYKLTEPYLKLKRDDTLHTIFSFMFGTGDTGAFVYTHQKRDISEFKFQLGQFMTIRDYW